MPPNEPASAFTDEDRERLEWWPNQARVEIREWPKDGTIPLRYGAYISAAYKDQVAVLRRASDPYWVRIFIRDWQVKAERYEKALREAADDLDKAANQFASFHESQQHGHTPEVCENHHIFARKARSARAALKGEENG